MLIIFNFVHNDLTKYSTPIAKRVCNITFLIIMHIFSSFIGVFVVIFNGYKRFVFLRYPSIQITLSECFQLIILNKGVSTRHFQYPSVHVKMLVLHHCHFNFNKIVKLISSTHPIRIVYGIQVIYQFG